MEPIRMGVLVFLIFFHVKKSAMQAVEVNETPYSTFTCENGSDIDSLDVCDGIFNCEDGTDEKGCENEAMLLYCTHEVGIDFLSYESNYGHTGCSERFEEVMRPCDSSASRDRCINDFERNYRDCLYNYAGRYENLNLNGIHLTSDSKFKVPMVRYSSHPYSSHPRSDTDFSSWISQKLRSNVKIISNGPQLDLFLSDDANLIRRTTRHGVKTNITTNEGNIKSPVVDSVTSNVYFITESRIKVCDQNFLICIPLKSKFIKNPTLLAISPKQRRLFWVERRSDALHYLVVHSLDQNSKPLPIRKDLRNPKWLTVDSAQDRIYWLDGDRDDTMRFSSSTFEGTNVKITNIIPEDTSFAVFDNTIYWPHTDQKKIMKCSANNCNSSVAVFKQTVGVDSIFSRIKSKLDGLIIDHCSSNSNKTTAHSCSGSSCSHMCLSESETEYQCYCQNSDLPLPNNSGGFCKDNTLVAVYRNFLLVIGLFNTDSISTLAKTQQHRLNISSIAAVAYNSVNGSIILSEVGEQKVYSWSPQSRELKLILDKGPGTINSLEFDNYSNNLYWIDPNVSVIRAMNLITGIEVTILKGNSTYVPIQFTLVQTKGFMIVLFLRDSSSITIERISMDGGSYSRKVLYKDDETYGVANLAVYYNKEFRWIYLLDRQTNEIRYLSEKISEFRYLVNDVAGKIESVAFLTNYIIWSGDGPVIKKARPVVDEVDFMVQIPVQEIPLNYDRKDSEDLGNGVMKLLGIEEQAVEPRLAKCLVNNGGCEKLCLVSRKHTKFTCSCPDGEELVDDTSCRKAERQPVQGERDTPKISSKNANVDVQSSTSGLYPDPRLTSTEMVDKNVKNTLQKKNLNITEIAGPDLPHINHTIREPPTNNSSCAGPVPQQDLPVPSIEYVSTSSSIIHVCYAILMAAIAIIAFVAGYLFRGTSPENKSIRFRTNSRSWELSNMNAESTVSICPRDDDSSRVLLTQNRQ